MEIGSPTLIVLPDLISQVLDFVTVDGRVEAGRMVDVDDDEPPQPVASTKLRLKTTSCRLLFLNPGNLNAIVLQGQFSVDLASEAAGGQLSASVRGKDIECFTAMNETLDFPVGVIEPTSFTMTVIKGAGQDPAAKNMTETSIKLVTENFLDVSVSMQDVVLMNVVATSLQELVAKGGGGGEEGGAAEGGGGASTRTTWTCTPASASRRTTTCRASGARPPGVTRS
jgi:hypothetical protein